MKHVFGGPLLAALLALGACGSKKPEAEPPIREVLPVRVRRAGTETTASQPTQYPGTVAEGSGTTVAFQVSGTITQLPIEQGQRVRRGQLLAALDATTYQEQYRAQLAQQRLAEDTYRRVQEVFDAGSVAETQLVQARQQAAQARASALASYQNVAHTRLYAPFDGYIGEKQTDLGAVAQPGAAVATLVQLREVKVNVAVPEADINRLRPGQAATVQVAAVPAGKLTGRIDNISPVADPQAHTFQVSVLVPNPRRLLKPSMTAQVAFAGTARGGAAGAAASAGLVLPLRAVQVDERGRHFVYLVRGHTARWHEVRAGDLVGDGLAVTAGLSSQDEVVVDGYHKLYDKAPVRVVQ